jgi:hypothetical protein
MQFHAKLGKNWNPKNNLNLNLNLKMKKRQVLVFISYFLYHLYKGGTSNTEEESQKSSLPCIVVNVATSTFQCWVFILFWTFHVKNKIFQFFKKRSLHKILFFGKKIFWKFENFNISGIDIIQCLLFLSLINFSPNFDL